MSCSVETPSAPSLIEPEYCCLNGAVLFYNHFAVVTANEDTGNLEVTKFSSNYVITGSASMPMSPYGAYGLGSLSLPGGLNQDRTAPVYRTHFSPVGNQEILGNLSLPKDEFKAWTGVSGHAYSLAGGKILGRRVWQNLVGDSLSEFITIDTYAPFSMRVIGQGSANLFVDAQGVAFGGKGCSPYGSCTWFVIPQPYGPYDNLPPTVSIPCSTIRTSSAIVRGLNATTAGQPYTTYILKPTDAPTYADWTEIYTVESGRRIAAFSIIGNTIIITTININVAGDADLRVSVDGGENFTVNGSVDASTALNMTAVQYAHGYYMTTNARYWTQNPSGPWFPVTNGYVSNMISTQIPPW